MASTLTVPKSHNLPRFIGKNYEIALKQSIETLLTSLGKSNSRNSTNFISEFQEFVQSRADPPLESIWVYTALNFTCPSTPKTEPFTRILAIKDLFQLIVSCSASCNSIKSIVLVAPVIHYLHSFILDVKGFQLGSKKERKVNVEIKSLLDSILGYINVCCNAFDGNVDELEGLIKPLEDLISFWLVDNGLQNNNVESLRVFFPLLSTDIVNRLSAEGCGMIDLAGYVVAEAFLLKLCWKSQEEIFGEKLQSELRSWIVASITGLRSSFFYVILVSMLLEPVLPVTSLMILEHEAGLRKLLFDALILVEYSFLSPRSLGQLPTKHAKRVILTKLIATHEAIELFRENGDQIKAISYLNAFSNSSLPSVIIKWIRSEIGNNEPTGSSPTAFLRCLINIENRGIKIFDDDMSRFRIAFNSKEETKQLADREDWSKPDSDMLFYIDNKGQEEGGSEEDEKTSESMSAAFIMAAQSMQSSERKRKTKDGEKRQQVKFVKYNVSMSGDVRNDGLDSGSDLENASSDEDMEIRK